MVRRIALSALKGLVELTKNNDGWSVKRVVSQLPYIETGLLAYALMSSMHLYSRMFYI